jgi:orotate phosphoribosyltransferase
MRVSPEEFLVALRGMLAAARELTPAPGTIVGIKRSGLMPAVYLSEKLKLPMLVDSELKRREAVPATPVLVVDTTYWTGKSLRKTVARLRRLGIADGDICTLVAYQRRDAQPKLENHRALALVDTIPVFWYHHSYPDE